MTDPMADPVTVPVTTTMTLAGKRASSADGQGGCTALASGFI